MEAAVGAAKLVEKHEVSKHGRKDKEDRGAKRKKRNREDRDGEAACEAELNPPTET